MQIAFGVFAGVFLQVRRKSRIIADFTDFAAFGMSIMKDCLNQDWRAVAQDRLDRVDA